ncbi:MAG: hypothetical protein J2P15_05435 [Micromonosporaceae bacterium]|nr:hypothetical protein [Micromonosporaceae bacterium]
MAIGAAAALVLAGAVYFGTSASGAGPSTSSTTTTTTTSTRSIKKVGTAAYQTVAAGSAAPSKISTEVPRAFGPEARGDAAGADGSARTNRSKAPAGAARAARVQDGMAAGAGADAVTASSAIHTGSQLLTSFDGLNHVDQRTANNGNQFSVEPPDQGLCVGGGHVVEALNDVFRVFNAGGTGQTGVVDLNTFFGYPPAIDRTTGVFGQVVTDPSCLYDPTTKAFFLSVLTLEVAPDTGDFTGDNHLDIAVSRNPTGTWDLYRLDVTDDGTNGTPVHPNCPCLGDYPHMGVDGNGFYLTTNEYPFFTDGFNSAQVYAFSKRSLARGDASVSVTQFDTTAADQGRNGFTIWPAQSPSTADYAQAAGGTEFFLSSNAAQEATGNNSYISNSIVTWSLTNTRSLDSSRPNLRLQHTRVRVATYSLPPAANQKPGSTPLADCLNQADCATLLLGGPSPDAPATEYALDSNDTRMQQVTYAGGKLYGALDTAVKLHGTAKAGVAWYIVRPSQGRSLSASLARQGQLGVSGNNITYPAIGVTAGGKGVMAFTLVGDGFYPSAAYASFDGNSGAGSIFVAKAGAGPEDGFAGYQVFNDPDPARPRWGDYGATAVDGGSIWIASEYIGQTCTFAQYTASPFGLCGNTRTALANWDTRISLIRP